MTTTPLPTWWPPSGSDEITEDQVRELFAYLRTVVPPVMADARRRIQARVGDDTVLVWRRTVESLAGKRLGSFDVLHIVLLTARTHDEKVSVAIGIRPDGRLATLEGTPERRQQEWVLWQQGAG